MCWNCNPEDLDGKGLEYNFDLVKDRLGATTHVHEVGKKVFGADYPFQQLIDLLVKADYAGWLLLEGYTHPKDGVAAMIKEKANYDNMIAAAKNGLK